MLSRRSPSKLKLNQYPKPRTSLVLKVSLPPRYCLLLDPKLNPRQAVSPQPPQVQQQSASVPPHLRHLQPGFKSVQPEAHRVAAPGKGSRLFRFSIFANISQTVVASLPHVQQQPTSIPPRLRHLQPGFKSVQEQPQSVATPSENPSLPFRSILTPFQAVVVAQPPRVEQSGHLPPHLQHLRPDFKPVQLQSQSATPSSGQNTAVVLPAALTAPRGVASVAPHLKGHESASSTPAPQTQITRPTQAQYLPPHLRRPAQVETPATAKPVQSQDKSVVSAQVQSVPPHLRRPAQVENPAASKPIQPQDQSVAPSQVNAVPPHLRGSVQISPPQMAIHQTAPHLQGISSHQISNFLQHKLTTSHQISNFLQHKLTTILQPLKLPQPWILLSTHLLVVQLMMAKMTS